MWSHSGSGPIRTTSDASPTASAIRISIDTAALASIASDWTEQTRATKPGVPEFDRSFVLWRSDAASGLRSSEAIYEPVLPETP